MRNPGGVPRQPTGATRIGVVAALLAAFLTLAASTFAVAGNPVAPGSLSPRMAVPALDPVSPGDLVTLPVTVTWEEAAGKEGRVGIESEGTPDSPRLYCVWLSLDASRLEPPDGGQQRVVIPLQPPAPAFHFFSFPVPAATPPGTYFLDLQGAVEEVHPAEQPPSAQGNLCPLPAAGGDAPPPRGTFHLRAGLTVRAAARVTWDPLPALEALPDTQVLLPLRVRNEGNAATVVQLEAAFASPLRGEGFRLASPAPETDHPDPYRIRFLLPPGHEETLQLALRTPRQRVHRPLSVAVRVSAADAPQPLGMMHTTIRVLPPSPQQVPPLQGHPVPAAIRGRWKPYPSRTGPEGAERLLMARYQLASLLPGARPGTLRLSWEPGSPSAPAPSGSALTLEELDYYHPGGWRLHKARGESPLGPFLLGSEEPLHLEGGSWLAAVAWKGSGLPGVFQDDRQEHAVLAAGWRPHSGSPFTVAYRFGSAGTSPATALRWRGSFSTGTLDQSLLWEGEGGWATTQGVSGWYGNFRWRTGGSTGGGELASDTDPLARARWEGRVRWRLAPPEFSDPVGWGYEEGELAVERFTFPAYVGVRLRSLHAWTKPFPGGTTHSALQLRGGTRLGRSNPTELDVRISRHLLSGTSPGSASTERAVVDEARWSLRRNVGAGRLLWSLRGWTGAASGWRSDLAWRVSSGTQGWWQLAVGRFREARGREGVSGWSADLQVGWKTRTSWRWRAGVYWPSIREGVPSSGRPRLTVMSPALGPWRGSLSVAAGPALQWEVAVERRFQLPWPFGSSGLGQVEGRLVGPLGADLSGAILQLAEYQVSTDREGRFRFPPVPPGTYRLHMERLPPAVAGQVLLPDPQEIQLQAGERKTIQMSLPAGGELWGQVESGPSSLREGGVPHGVTLRVELMDERGAPVAETWVAAGSEFRFPRLAPGPYRLRLTLAPPQGGSSGASSPSVHPVWIEAGEVTRVSLPLPPPASPPRLTFYGELAVPRGEGTASRP